VLCYNCPSRVLDSRSFRSDPHTASLQAISNANYCEIRATVGSQRSLYFQLLHHSS